MIPLISGGVLALVLGAYGLVMLRRRARLHAVAAELGAEYLDDGWTKPGGVRGQGFTIRVESPRRTFRTNIEVAARAPGDYVIDPGFFASPYDWSHVKVPGTVTQRAFVVHVSLPGYDPPDDAQRDALARWLERGASAHRVHPDMLDTAGITRIYVSRDTVATSITGVVTDAPRLRRAVDLLSRLAGAR
jgi:hypothetical protein